MILLLEFIDITTDNVHLYCSFEKRYREELKQFRTPIYPENSDFFTVLQKKNMLEWSYLYHEGKIIGAIWLQKDHPSLKTARLGIFIADKNLRSKGLGSYAILKYIERSKKILNLQKITLTVPKENIRAINCYKKCGFVPRQEYEEADGTKMYKMTKQIKRSYMQRAVTAGVTA